MRLLPRWDGLLEDEAELVWLESPGGLSYVREDLVACRTRDRRPGPSATPLGRLVGYAVLRPDAVGTRCETTDQSAFWRRVIWLAAWDRGEVDDCGRYAEWFPRLAVDPSSITIRRWGRWAWAEASDA